MIELYLTACLLGGALWWTVKTIKDQRRDDARHDAKFSAFMLERSHTVRGLFPEFGQIYDESVHSEETSRYPLGEDPTTVVTKQHKSLKALGLDPDDRDPSISVALGSED